MKYTDLKTLWREYTHRTDLTDNYLDQVLLMVVNRLGRDLKSLANEYIETLVFTDGIAPLPKGFNEARYLYDGKTFPDYVTPKQYYKGFWTIIRGEVVYAADEATLVYWGEPLIIDDSIEDDYALNRHLPLYLYGGIAEIGRFLNDQDMIDSSMNQYMMELKDTNKSEAAARVGNNPIMR